MKRALVLAFAALSACGDPIDGEWTFTIDPPDLHPTTGKFELSFGDGLGTFKLYGDEERELDVRTTVTETRIELRMAVKGLDTELVVRGTLLDVDPAIEGFDKIDGVAEDAKGITNQFTAFKVDPDAPEVRPIGPAQ